jgi:predicted RNA-binding protein YlqC (UPF0109 family)
MINEVAVEHEFDLFADLVGEVVGGFISHPNALHLQWTVLGRSRVLDIQLEAHPDDNPKIVGKGGKNLAALNALFSQIASKFEMSARVSLRDRCERRHPANKGFENNPKWPRTRFVRLLNMVLGALCVKLPRVHERIIPGRRSYLGEMIDDHSLFYITPDYSDLPVFKREVEMSLEIIFRAIGQQQGRRVNLSFVDEGIGEPLHTPQTKPPLEA